MYQPQYYTNYLYPQQLQQQFPQEQKQQQQLERYGFISVNNEQQARNWPIAPGNSLTFKDESSPYIYTKTMGLSQFETPIFEKYKLTKEEPQLEEKEENNNNDNQLNKIIVNLQMDFDSLKNELEEVKNQLRQVSNPSSAKVKILKKEDV